MPRSSDQSKPSVFIWLGIFSIVLWIYLFRKFIGLHTPLQGDAYAYLGHFRLFVENIAQGSYPLWSYDDWGQPNEFFLRRIGEFNPFFWFIVLFDKMGFPFEKIYQAFLIGYCFLGVTGFYLLSQRIFRCQQSSFVASLLFLFSCLTASIFETFLILETVPFIWFAFFLVALIQSRRKEFLLGLTFSLMIINITYIPFYFYTIFTVFILSFIVFNFFKAKEFYLKAKEFVGAHQIFTIICIFLLAVSFIPGTLWYTQFQQKEVKIIQRDSQSKEYNPGTVEIDKVNEGGIDPFFILGRQLTNLDRIEIDDFYISVFSFLILLSAAWGYYNRRLSVFFVFLFIIFLIGLADSCSLHKFLYSNIPFFKYFRNLQFFLWMAILPVFILFIVEQMRIFVQDCRQERIHKKAISLWIIAVHLTAAGIYLYSKAPGFASYVAMICSLAWMLGQIWSKNQSNIWVWVLWIAVIIQPFEVYARVSMIYPSEYKIIQHPRPKPNPPSIQKAQDIMNDYKKPKGAHFKDTFPYFSTQSYYEAKTSIDQKILGNYLNSAYVLYDTVERMPQKIDAQRIQDSLEQFTNVAYVHAEHVDQGRPNSPSKARIINSSDQDFEVLKYSSNDIQVRTNFNTSQFLVRTVNYHSRWRVFIDGKPSELFRTNITVQGVWVPAGQHIVHWQYEASWRYVLAYFLMSLYVFALGWLIWLSIRSRKFGTQS